MPSSQASLVAIRKKQQGGRPLRPLTGSAEGSCRVVSYNPSGGGRDPFVGARILAYIKGQDPTVNFGIVSDFYVHPIFVDLGFPLVPHVYPLLFPPYMFFYFILFSTISYL